MSGRLCLELVEAKEAQKLLWNPLDEDKTRKSHWFADAGVSMSRYGLLAACNEYVITSYFNSDWIPSKQPLYHYQHARICSGYGMHRQGMQDYM
jgi:hypothetical protein